MLEVVYEAAGYCPICERAAVFRAHQAWLRDYLLCTGCGSIPRERALAAVLTGYFPAWRDLRIHESSPGVRGISVKLARECPGYVATHYFRDEPPGAITRGFRNENLERQTWADETFDVVVSLDVMEHVNEPRDVISEVWRTLKPGGAYIFTAPTNKDVVETMRLAHIDSQGEVEQLVEPPEIHGNPLSDAGSLVTFRYGYDLPELIGAWAQFDTVVHRFHDRTHGILGEFTEVYVCEKWRTHSGPPAQAIDRPS